MCVEKDPEHRLQQPGIICSSVQHHIILTVCIILLALTVTLVVAFKTIF
jgi:hypothetical protein